MPCVLVAYATAHGQTARIATRLAEELRALGIKAEPRDVRHLPRGLVVAHFDAAILGARVHFGSHGRRLLRFAREHAAALNTMPSAFFSVSLSAASRDPLERAAAEELMERFPRQSGWHPRLQAAFAGGLPYGLYGVLLRPFMRRMARRCGLNTDASRDEQYTDWGDVRRLAQSLAGELAASRVHAGAASAEAQPTVH